MRRRAGLGSHPTRLKSHVLALSLLLTRPCRSASTAAIRTVLLERPVLMRGLTGLAGHTSSPSSCAGLVTLIWRFPPGVPDLVLFIGLLLASSLASSHRLRLPLGTSSSTLSVSYAIDFAVAVPPRHRPDDAGRRPRAPGPSPRSVRPHGPTSRNPPVRVVFNVAALVLTVQAAGSRSRSFGPTESHAALADLAAAHGGRRAGLLPGQHGARGRRPSRSAGGQRVWKVWESNFLWTAPSYFVGAGAAVAAVAMWNADRGWLLPLVARPGLPHVPVLRDLHGPPGGRSASQRGGDAPPQRRRGRPRRRKTLGATLCAGRRRFERRSVGLGHARGCALLLRALEADAGAAGADRRSTRSSSGWRSSSRTSRPGLRARARRAPRRARPRTSSTSTGRAIRRRRRGGCSAAASRCGTTRSSPVRMAGSQTDVTEWRRVQDTLATAARHDHLTGPAQPAAVQRAAAAVDGAERAAPPEPSYAVLFIDLDGFKLVNDSLGHLVGDQFLVAIADAAAGAAAAGRRAGAARRRRVRRAHRRLRVARRGVPGRRAAAARAASSRSSSQGRELYASASIGIVLGGAAVPHRGRPAARRRHRDVPRQGGRPRRLPAVRPARCTPARCGG